MEPIYVGNLLQTHAKILYIGKSSMQIGVTVYVEDMISGERKKAITAFFTMVALDKANKPKQVPPLILETEKDKLNYEFGKAKFEESKSRMRVEWDL